MAGNRITAVIIRVIHITEVAITTEDTHTDTAIIHTVIITPITAPVLLTLTTDIPIGITTIQS